MSLLRVVTVILGFHFFLVGVDCDNYPSDDLHPKPCARIKYTVTYLNRICEPDCNGAFTDESSRNCEGEFKDTCPEFNKASCEWFTLNFSDGPREIPTCHLRYSANHFAWMGIYYTHQYGSWMTDSKWNKTQGSNCSNLSINCIVEVHRFVKKYGAFGSRDGDGDWPKSVIDATGERGLKWTQVTDFKPLPDDLRNNTGQLCSDQSQDIQSALCGVSFTKYLTNNGYYIGFDNAANPKPSGNENNTANNVTYIQSGRCTDLMVGVPGNQTVQRGCQVLYTRRTTFTPAGSFRYICEFVYLEANLYTPSATNLSHLQMRYAYWFSEDPNDREKISCRLATPNDY